MIEVDLTDDENVNWLRDLNAYAKVDNHAELENDENEDESDEG